MEIKNRRSDIALSDKVRKRRESFLENLPISLEDKTMELAASLGGRFTDKIIINPKRGIANYVGFENLNLEGYDIIIPENKETIQAVIVGHLETYLFHTKSRAMEKYGMEQKEYYESVIKPNQK